MTVAAVSSGNSGSGPAVVCLFWGSRYQSQFKRRVPSFLTAITRRMHLQLACADLSVVCSANLQLASPSLEL
jgi:hypothetical protein